ncbi:MAG: hypothetical protein V3T65_02325 [Acidobacteriota bacterium]
MENYYNYFTEIEEYFWKKRGTALLISTLDWALIDSWKEAQIPLEAVLRGIDRAFEKHESRRNKARKVNSLAYCHQEIVAAAAEKQRSALHHGSEGEPFPREELATFLDRNAAALEIASRQFEEQERPESAATFRSMATSLAELATAARSNAPMNLEETEQRLSVLEEKMFSTLQQTAAENELVAIRSEMDRELVSVRRKMNAEQIALIQKQFLQRKLLEASELPRLSLFYL